MAAQLDIAIKKNADFALTLYWRDGGRVPFDLTGYGAKMQIRDRATGALIAEFSTANGKILITGTEGKIAIASSAAENAVLVGEEGEYDLIMNSPGGQATCLVEGNVELRAGVTQ